MLAALLVAAAAAATDPHAAPLVDVAARAPRVLVDLRYATADNFARAPLYSPGARCLLAAPIAERVARVEARLEKIGLRLKAWDCYRPLSVQRELWKRFPRRGYVADPANGSLHNRGTALDATVVALDGAPVAVPTDFDAFTPAAWADAPCPPEAAKNRAALAAAMRAENFTQNRHEWWHFGARNGKLFPVRDEPIAP